MHEYDDIIDHPHYRHPGHPAMAPEARAGQFSPFSALDGLEDAIEGQICTGDQ